MNTPFDIQQLWNLPTNEFMDLAKQLCVFQASNNPVYKQWIKLSNQSISELETPDAIPFLPISFFKNQDVFIGEKPNTLFESSGTSQDVVSKHWVVDTKIYEASFFNCFEHFYGKPSKYCIIGLLPSYLERQHSSLVYMVDKLIQASGHPQSGFYLNEFEKLNEVLKGNYVHFKLNSNRPNTETALNHLIYKDPALIQYYIPKRQNGTTVLTFLDVSLSIDGLAGLSCGEYFQIDGVPEVYNMNGFFQVTNVKHQIEPDGWKTVVEAGYRISSKAA